jgi:hypothetical protein
VPVGALFLVPNFFGPEGDSGVTLRFTDEPVVTRFQRRGANYSVMAKVVFLAEHAVHEHGPHDVHFQPRGRLMATVYPNGCVPGHMGVLLPLPSAVARAIPPLLSKMQHCVQVAARGLMGSLWRSPFC